MHKIIVKVVFVHVFAFTVGYGIYITQAENELSDLALDNVEALALGESGVVACCFSPGDYCEAANGDLLLDYVECFV